MLLHIFIADEIEQASMIRGWAADSGSKRDDQIMLQETGLAEWRSRGLMDQTGHVGAPTESVLPPAAQHLPSQSTRPSFQDPGKVNSQVHSAKAAQGAEISPDSYMAQTDQAEIEAPFPWAGHISSFLKTVAGDGGWWQLEKKSSVDPSKPDAMPKQSGLSLSDQNRRVGFVEPDGGFVNPVAGGTLPAADTLPGKVPVSILILRICSMSEASHTPA